MVTRNDQQSRERGFTLVELLVVVLILGIVSGMAVIAVGGVRRTSTVQACTTDWQTFDSALKAYGTDHLVPATGLPDYSGLTSNPLQVLATNRYLSNTTVADPRRYSQTVSITGGGTGYAIQISNAQGGSATTLTDTSAPTAASAACSTAIGS